MARGPYRVTRDVIDAASLLAFWVMLFVGAVSVIARLVFYRVHRYRQPRLLIRDAILLGGFSISFGLVLLGRVAVSNGWVTPEELRDSVPWGLATVIPAILSVGAFAYFELFVIERGAPRVEHRHKIELQRPQDDDMDPRVPDVAGE